MDADGYCERCGHAQLRERDRLEQVDGPVAVATDIGKRHHRNEDFFAITAGARASGGEPADVAVVCDGVSSSTRPDEASAVAARAACSWLGRELADGGDARYAMFDAILRAHQAVTALAEGGSPEQNSPACTIVAVVGQSRVATVGWVGDSRAYWVPDDRTAPACRLTEDDSWAAQMVAAGLMTEAEAAADPRAHAITGWLGADAGEVEPHVASFAPERPGVVVVCTDGLWNYAESAAEMAAAVPADARVRPLEAARALVAHALRGGGHDNVTVALVPFPAYPARAGSA
ncbi:PP2C family protein-serine/threonine phosphatase [Streptomyces durbertensis]|uniref:PP2C family protein-serine/threonine phosphatase n=1 Tax=Streptomyces durbertensis TaxID=2448886 RepID=UPI003F69E24D